MGDQEGRYKRDEPVTVVISGYADSEWDACGPRGGVVRTLTVVYDGGRQIDVPDGSADVTIIRGHDVTVTPGTSP